MNLSVSKPSKPLTRNRSPSLLTAVSESINVKDFPYSSKIFIYYSFSKADIILRASGLLLRTWLTQFIKSFMPLVLVLIKFFLRPLFFKSLSDIFEYLVHIDFNWF